MTRREPSFVAVFPCTVRHPFRRLADWIAELSQLGEYRSHVQHGPTPPPTGLAGTPMPGITAMSNLMRRADAVITHAGPGLTMDARNAGHLAAAVAPTRHRRCRRPEVTLRCSAVSRRRSKGS